jgi:hypothetical protein
MIVVYIATLLLLIGPIISFLKDRAVIIEKNNRASAWAIPIAFLVVGVLSAALSFYNSKSSLDAKAVSDSTAIANQKKYDSLNNREINFLGAGSARPLFGFLAMSSTVFQFMIMDTASYPMRDIRVTVRDELALTDYRKTFKSTISDSTLYKRDLWIYELQGFSNYGKEFRIPFLPYNDFNTLYIENIGNRTHLKYTVDITWSNGDLAYYIECFKNNNSWNEKRTCYDRINKVPVNE